MSHPGKWPLVGNQLWGLGCAKLLLVLSGALGFELLNLSGAGGESTAAWLPWLVFKLSFLSSWGWGGCRAVLGTREILVLSPHHVPPVPCPSYLEAGASWVNLDLV